MPFVASLTSATIFSMNSLDSTTYGHGLFLMVPGFGCLINCCFPNLLEFVCIFPGSWEEPVTPFALRGVGTALFLAWPAPQILPHRTWGDDSQWLPHQHHCLLTMPGLLPWPGVYWLCSWLLKSSP